MQLQIDSKYAIVTGGASGLGRAFCLELARDGWNVAIVDIDRTGAEDTLQILAQRGGRGIVEIFDVADQSAWRSLVLRLRSEWPRLDLLINNAGICGAGLVGEFSWENTSRILDVNLLGVMHGCQHCVPWLKESAPGGHIINIASLAAIISAPSMAAYNVSKAGVIALTETLSNELGESGIGVTVVIPGFFDSRLLDRGRFEDHRLLRIAQEYTRRAEFDTEDIVAQTMRALAHRKLYVILGRRSRFVSRLKRVAPSWFLRIVARTFARDLKRVIEADSDKV